MIDYGISVSSSVFEGVLNSQLLTFQGNPIDQVEEDHIILFKESDHEGNLIGRKHLVGVSSVDFNKEENNLTIGIFDIMVSGSGTGQALEKTRNPLSVGEMGYVLTVARDFTEEDEYDDLDKLLKEYRTLDLEDFDLWLNDIQNETEEAFIYILMDNLMELIHKGGYTGKE
ncbi:hypothetical protein [Bacillus toyonensis]|uniref:hypothetical protein n=1 Tax=Bacillus toyonensis TaxID=155322 RepID=UPI000BF7E54C|nr:hypothetical protein [Bacillus toyonensis]PGF05307.1 hypothetical protein COM61_02535 [Bacillus toyonensis]